MLRDLWLGLRIAFLFVVGGCAHAPPPVPTPPVEVEVDTRPAIRGNPGEDVGHLHARLIVRACVGEEFEHLVVQVQNFVDACLIDGHKMPECQWAACDKLRDADRRRCPDLASR